MTTKTPTKPTSTAIQTPDPLTQLRATATRAATNVATAQAAVLAAQQAAMAPTLHQRDMEHLQRTGIFPEGDPAVIAAIDAGNAARQRLGAARATVLRAQQEQARADALMAAATAGADQEWRRVWAEAHYPELVNRQAAARAEEAKVRANPYTGTSSQAMGDLRFAQARIVAVEEALGRVAKQAPPLGTDVALPADWAALTPEQKRAWALRADQLATLAG